jgi:hypothetical protein
MQMLMFACFCIMMVLHGIRLIVSVSDIFSVSIFKSGETYGPAVYYSGSLGSNFAFNIKTDSPKR